MSFRSPDLLPMQDLRNCCPLVTVESVKEGLVGKNRGGEVVIRVRGKCNAGLIRKFRQAYYLAEKAGILKGERA